MRSELSNTIDSLATVTTIMGSTGSMGCLLYVLDNDPGSRSSDFPDFVGTGVVAQPAPVGDSLNHGVVNNIEEY